MGSGIQTPTGRGLVGRQSQTRKEQVLSRRAGAVVLKARSPALLWPISPSAHVKSNEKAEREPIVSSQRETVEAILAAHSKRAVSKAWKERIIGFMLGMLASILAGVVYRLLQWLERRLSTASAACGLPCQGHPHPSIHPTCTQQYRPKKCGGTCISPFGGRY